MSSSQITEPMENGHVGPHPSYIEIAKPYIFEPRIKECLNAAGVSEAKDDSIRLQGVAWIDSVRKAMHLQAKTTTSLLQSAKAHLYRPVRTYNTAAVYYHKFRLVHPDSNGYIVSISALRLSFVI